MKRPLKDPLICSLSLVVSISWYGSTRYDWNDQNSIISGYCAIEISFQSDFLTWLFNLIYCVLCHVFFWCLFLFFATNIVQHSSSQTDSKVHLIANLGLGDVRSKSSLKWRKLEHSYLLPFIDSMELCKLKDIDCNCGMVTCNTKMDSFKLLKSNFDPI